MWTNDVHAVECVPFVSGCRGKLGGRREEIMRIVSVPLLVHYAPATWRALFDSVVPFKSGEAVTHNSVHITRGHGCSSTACNLDGHVRVHVHIKMTTPHVKNSFSSMINSEIK
ncbi:uncharacterized protein LOC142589000 [Dermacentor variabilis]|uniref:uncharacterized protein LOC142589000 n=1 Tax=Dermacentor variabilis TaxID=34621 RepID=UPI003F5C13B5